MWSNRQGIESYRETSCYNLLGVCRLCMLDGCSNMEPIFRSTIPNCTSNKIASVTRLLLIEGDGLPAVVCQQCLFQLDVADTFIRRCLQSDRFFRNQLTQGVCETESSRLGSPAVMNLSTTSALVSQHLTRDFVNQDLEATIAQDPDEHTSAITAIKQEVADGTIDDEEEPAEAYFEQESALQGDEHAENFSMNTICIKMEEIDVAELADGKKIRNCNGLPAVSDDNTRSHCDLIQTLAEVVKFKCSICSLEFTKKCGLLNHHRFHLRQQRKEKISVAKGKSLFKKKKAIDSSNMAVVLGPPPKRDHVKVRKNSKVQGGRGPLPIAENGEGSKGAPRLRSEVRLSQLPTNEFKCTLCLLDFSSRKSLVLHCLRAKAHKAGGKSQTSRNQQGYDSTIADQQRPNRRTSSSSQNVCVDKQVTSLTSEPANHDATANTFTTDGHESVAQPKRNKILAGSKKFKCSKCSFKFLTKRKRALHICNVKDNREQIFQRHLRIRVPRKNSDCKPETQNHTTQGVNVSPSFEFSGIQENTSDNPEKTPEVVLALPILDGQDGLAQDTQKHILEKSINVLAATKLRKKDPEVLAEPVTKQLKKFKCKICFVEFSSSIHLARHMWEASGHNLCQGKQCLPMKTDKTKPVKEPKMAETKAHDAENRPLAKRASVVAVPMLGDPSATDLLLEETMTGEPDRRFAVKLPLSKDQNASTVSSAHTHNESLTQAENCSLVTDSEHFQCASCLLMISSPLCLARHVCHAVSQANIEEGLHGRLIQVPTREKSKKKPQPTETSKEIALFDFHSKANSCDKVAAVSKKKVVAVLDQTKDRSQMPLEITESLGTSTKLLPNAASCALTSQSKVLSNSIVNKKPLKHKSKSSTVKQQCSSISFDKSQESYELIANGNGSKRIRVSPNLKSNPNLKKQNAIPSLNAVENNFDLPSKERFLGNQDLSNLQGIQNVRNRKLMVKLNRLIVASDEEKTDGMLPTQSKNFSPITDESCNSYDMNEKFQEKIMSNGCSDLNDIENETMCLLASIKSLETEEENKPHAEGRGLQPEVAKIPALSPKNHKKEILRKHFLGKANARDLPPSSTFNSSNDSVCVSDMKQDVDISKQQCNAMSDSISNNKQMQLRKMGLSCSGCSALFSVVTDLASHAKCLEKHKNLTRVRKTFFPKPEAETGSSFTPKTLSTTCDGCSQAFLSRNTLKKHKLIHSCGTKSHQCHL